MRDAIDFRAPAGEGTFLASDGVSLFCRWQLATPSLARIFVVHGAAEHSGRYEFLCTFLQTHGYSVFAADHRGMGRSSGPTGDVENFGKYVEDLERFVSLVEGALGAAPTFLLGHSMGTVVTVRYALQHPTGLRGLVLMSMPVAITARPGPILDRLAKAASRYLPQLKVPIGIRSEQLSSDQAVVKAAEDDPLIDRFATLRWSTAMLDASNTLETLVKRVAKPILVMHGEQDTIADCSGVLNLKRGLANSLSRVVIFPGLRHELHNEAKPSRENVFATLLEWLKMIG